MYQVEGFRVKNFLFLLGVIISKNDKCHKNSLVVTKSKGQTLAFLNS